MITEKLFFLQIISDHIKKRNTTIIPENMNWNLIVKYAQDHQIGGIVYYQCKNYLQKESNLNDIYQILYKDYYVSGYRYGQIKIIIDELKEILCEEKIPFLLVKGILISRYYPIPALRTMCDIDIVLINENDREQANLAMNRVGYVTEKSAFEWNLYRKDIGVELHDRLVYGEDEKKSNRGVFFNDFRNHIISTNNGCYELEKDYHFIYLIEHLRKHFTSHGVGFRQFIDVAVMCLTYGSKFNWIWIEENCKKIQIWDFTTHVLSFCHEWWDLDFDVPFQLPSHSKEFWEDATNSIFQNGIFGFQNDNHLENAIRSIRHPQKVPSVFRAIILGINLICRPYSEMIRYPYCAFLKNKKLLLPFAWIHRIIHISKSEKIYMGNILKKIYKAVNNDDYYINYKNKWGL